MGTYAGFGEHDTDPKVLNAIVEKYKVMLEDDTFPKILFGPYTVASDFGHKLLFIFEAESDEQMIKLGKHFYSLVKLNWTPIYHVSAVWEELLREHGLI